MRDVHGLSEQTELDSDEHDDSYESRDYSPLVYQHQARSSRNK